MTQSAEVPAVVEVPAVPTSEWVMLLQQQLDQMSRRGVEAVPKCLTVRALKPLLERAEAIFKAESTLLELEITDPAATVTTVGDTHGQFHDVLRLFAAAGYPGEQSYFIFNGDFVDRGAWGLETLVLLLAWKLALPQRVFLLRGNHESATCTVIYGFKEELKAKYGKAVWQEVYTRCKRVFSVLPLAARVQRVTLVLHGGLFRQQPRSVKVAKGKRKRGNPVILGGAATLGTLEDLAVASRGGVDPSGVGSNRLASDVLWSDPTSLPGFQPNFSRGIGMTFGPDVTERFLRDNGLKLILRSHEGPDAREGREDMAPMTEGWTLDHDTPCGKLMTVFSAPEYPQFVADEAERVHNKAAVAVLSAPDYATPRMVQFEAELPRPEAQPYYALDLPGSDDEFEPASSDISGMSGASEASNLSAASDDAAFDGTAAAAAEGAVEQLAVAVPQQEQQQQDREGPVEGQEAVGAAESGAAAGALVQEQTLAGEAGVAAGQAQEQVAAVPSSVVQLFDAAPVGVAEQQSGPGSVLALFEGVPLASDSTETSTGGSSKENETDNDNGVLTVERGLTMGESIKAAAAAVPVQCEAA